MIRLMQSTFYKEAETKEALCDFIRGAAQLSMDKECAAFEREFATKQGRTYAVLVSSGSAANLVLIQALFNLGMLSRGDRVGFSALTWPTNVMPLIQHGCVPVPIDCDSTTLNVSSETLEPVLGSLRAVFLTNVLGFCSDLPVIERMCRERGVLLVEDNCESLGSVIEGRQLGNFGLASTFSFFVGHHLSAIEGGMICTDDDALHEMLVMVRAHGWDRNLHSERQHYHRTKHGIEDFFAKYTFYDLAYNARPTEITGFLGRSQLRYWDEIVEKRAHRFQQFHAAAQKHPWLVPLDVRHMEIVSNFAMPVLCADDATFFAMQQRFNDADVEIRPVIAGDMTQQPFYRARVSNTHACPQSLAIHRRGFYFPNHPELSEEDVEHLVDLLRP